MELIIFAGVVGGGRVVAVVVLVMLNRAWGNFPGPISGLPPMMPLDQPTPSRAAVPSAPLADTHEVTPDDELLVPVNHPLVRRAVMAALERGGSPYALYFVRDGEEIYLVPTRIADPQQREQLMRLFTSMNTNSSGDTMPSLGEAIRLIQEMGRK